MSTMTVSQQGQRMIEDMRLRSLAPRTQEKLRPALTERFPVYPQKQTSILGLARTQQKCQVLTLRRLLSPQELS